MFIYINNSFIFFGYVTLQNLKLLGDDKYWLASIASKGNICHIGSEVIGWFDILNLR